MAEREKRRKEARSHAYVKHSGTCVCVLVVAVVGGGGVECVCARLC